MFCIQCGAKIDENKNFCGNCGHPLMKPIVVESNSPSSPFTLEKSKEQLQKPEAGTHSDEAPRRTLWMRARPYVLFLLWFAMTINAFTFVMFAISHSRLPQSFYSGPAFGALCLGAMHAKKNKFLGALLGIVIMIVVFGATQGIIRAAIE